MKTFLTLATYATWETYNINVTWDVHMKRLSCMIVILQNVVFNFLHHVDVLIVGSRDGLDPEWPKYLILTPPSTCSFQNMMKKG